MQAATLPVKISLTKQRLREWVEHYGLDKVFISFSGGKDSTVLLHIAREMYPSIKAVFFDTGLEYPEIREFVRSYENVDWVRPDMNFKDVIAKYGYPFISKEVGECVFGARKYLTKLQEELASRQSVSQSVSQSLPYEYYFRRLTGTGEYKKPERTFEGGVRRKVS